VVPIPFMGMEALIQSSEVVIPLLKARMADAKTVTLQALSSALYSIPSGGSAGLQLDSLPMAYDSGANVATYGNISRSLAANSFWQSNLYTSVGGILSRAGFIPYITRVTVAAGGETPDFGVLSFGDWTTLMADYISAERIVTTRSSKFGRDDVTNAGFAGLMLGDTPIFPDPFATTGTGYLLNSKYLAAYISEDAPFAFSGFYSAIPNLQIANVGVMIVALDVVCTKPVTGAQLQGITGGAF